MQKGRCGLKAIAPFYALLLLIHIIPLLVSDGRLWGIDQWRYIPGPLLFITVLAGLLPLIPSFRERLAGAIAGLLEPGKYRTGGWKRTLWVMAALVFSAMIFTLARQKTFFLGDGYLWIKILKSGELGRYWDLTILAWLYSGIHKLTSAVYPFGPVSIEASAVIVSVMSGVLFIVFGWKTVSVLAQETGEKLLLFLALLSSGTMMLFFGYIEAYPPLAAATMIFLYYGSLYLHGDVGLIAPVAALLPALALHPSLAPLLPGMFLLPWLRGEKIPGWKRYFLLLAYTAAGCFLLLLILQSSGILKSFFRESLLPVFGGGGVNRVPYPVFSAGNLLDLLNEILLVSPVIIIAAAAVMRRRSRDTGGGPTGEIIFFMTVSAFFIMEYLVVNKLIGASRDWDIFSTMALPLSLMAALLIIRSYRKRVLEFAVFIIFIILLQNVPWIGINASDDLSMKRFEDLAANRRWSAYASGYAFDELATFYLDRGNESRAILYSRRAMRADQGNIRYLYNAATRHMMCNRHDETIRLYKKVLEKNPEYIQARLNLGILYVNLGRSDEAVLEFLETIRIDSTCATGYERLASICFELGDLRRSAAFFEKYLSLSPDDHNVRFQLAVLLDRLGHPRAAIGHFHRLLGVGMDETGILNNIGVIHCKSNEFVEALAVFERALRLSPDNIPVHENLARMRHLRGEDETAWNHVFHIERLGGKVPEELISELELTMKRPSR